MLEREKGGEVGRWARSEPKNGLKMVIIAKSDGKWRVIAINNMLW